MVTNWPADKLVKVGQRWVRREKESSISSTSSTNVFIIEITVTNGKMILGPIIQVIQGKTAPEWFHKNCYWTSDPKYSDYADYAYLDGQDAPNGTP